MAAGQEVPALAPVPVDTVAERAESEAPAVEVRVVEAPDNGMSQSPISKFSYALPPLGTEVGIPTAVSTVPDFPYTH